MELTNEHIKAIDAFEGDAPVVFLTGEAGTGKSTLVNHWLTKTSRNVIKLAPTGLAALNIDGQTIHSFFKFDPNERLAHLGTLKPLSEAVFKGFDTIIIDEISMVRADIMYSINFVLSLTNGQPFGGKKIICVGDMCQLPPVVTQKDEQTELSETFGGIYWHFGIVDKSIIKTVKLTKIFRQSDAEFTSLLNNVRNNQNVESTIKKLNSKTFKKKASEFAVFICTTNKLADTINENELNKLTTPLFSFEAKSMGNMGKDKPAPEFLQVKVGAKVMFTVNNATKNFVNGQMGIVLEIQEKAGVILVQKSDGEKIEVEKYTWAKGDYQIEEDEEGKKSLKLKKTAYYTQYPLKIAYAITIHKSQGQTFDAVSLDLGYGAFAHGQAYVALSRCKSIEKLSLVKPLKITDISKFYDRKALI